MDSHKKTYEWIYSSTSPKLSRYGHSNHGRKAIPLIPPHTTSLLDIGCGHNEFVNSLPPHISGIGIDFACPSADAVTSAVEFAASHSATFDCITAFDVLEHIPEDELQANLSAIASLLHPQGAFIASICTRDSAFRGPNGESLHPTVKPMDWWKATLRKHFSHLEDNGLYLRMRFSVEVD